MITTLLGVWCLWGSAGNAIVYPEHGLPRQPNRFYVIVRGVQPGTTVDFESEPWAWRVRVANVPFTRRGFVTRVEARDLPLMQGDDLLVVVNTEVAGLGHFKLGTVRLRTAGATHEHPVEVELLDAPLPHDPVAEARIAALTSPLFGALSQDGTSACPQPGGVHILLDPGHDNIGQVGARSLTGVGESEFNDALVASVRQALSDEPGLRVSLSRPLGGSRSMTGRIKRIRAEQPDLVLSIHHDNVRPERQMGSRARNPGHKDAHQCPHRRGFSMYVSMEGKDPELAYQLARYLAAEELAAGRPVGRFFSWGEPQFGIYRGEGLSLIAKTRIPTVLFEVGYVCNPQEERQLRSPGFQRAQARRIARAIRRTVRVAVCHQLRMPSPWFPPPVTVPPAQAEGSR